MDNNSGIEDVKLVVARSATDLLSVVLDKATCPVIYVGEDYRYKYVNKAYSDWFGVSEQEIVGQKVETFLGQEIFSHIKSYMDLSLGGDPVRFEDEIPYNTGTRVIEFTYAPDFSDDGQVR